jgi:hypothetical protein
MTRTESLDELTSLRRNITPEENQLVGLGVLNAWANRTRKGYLVCGPLTDETNRHGLNAVRAIGSVSPYMHPALVDKARFVATFQARDAFRAALAAVGLRSL